MKRFGTNKDLVMENFGRQVRIFEELKNLGHNVDFLCMDYKKLESKMVRKNGISYFIEPFGMGKFNSFLKKLNFLLKHNRYDVLVGTTSPALGIIGYYYSKRHKIKFAYELQDAYDIYGEYKIPLLRLIDRYVVKNSDVVICVSNTLKKRIRKYRKKPIYVVQNGIEGNLFKPLDRIKCRKNLNLPKGAKIIVYVGLISKIKGFDVLLSSFEKLRKRYEDCILLVSGKVDKGIELNHENLIFKELAKRTQVVDAINAADVAVIPNPRNMFTEFCFPYKLVEYMACKVPIVATQVGDTGLLLKGYEGSLCMPSDSNDLAEKIIAKLEKASRVDYGKDLQKFKWEILGRKFERALIMRHS